MGEPTVSAEQRIKQIRYSYDGSPTLARFAQNNSNMRGLMGPFGSGKSSACAIEVVSRGLRQAPPDRSQPPGPGNVAKSRWAVVRNTFRQLESTTQKTFFDWFPPHYFGKWVDRIHTYTMTGFRGFELEVIFIALDRPEHTDNLLSLELTGAWVNEAREVPWELIRVLARRCNRYPSMREGGASWWGVWADTNPPPMQSEWFDYFEKSRPENAAIFKQPSGLAPNAENKRHLPATYYTDMLNDLTDEEQRVYIHGEYGFITDGQPVYPEWRDQIHLSEAATARRDAGPIKRSWDFGLTPACIFTQNQANGRKHVLAELCAQRAGVDQFSDEVLRFCSRQWPGYAFEDVGDPSGSYDSDTREESCFDILVSKGIGIVGGNQNLDARIESVRWGLRTLIDGAPALIVHPSCEMLVGGFKGGYKHRRLLVSGGTRYDRKPLKNEFSHPHDALQYDCEQDFGNLGAGVASRQQTPQTRAQDDYDPFEQLRGRDARDDTDLPHYAADAGWEPLGELYDA